MLVQPLLLLLSVPSFSRASVPISSPTQNTSFTLGHITEWTAIGDSYASGMGAGALPQDPDPERCFRCSRAYAKIMQSGQGSLQPNPEKFNFVACNGAVFSEILDKQVNERGRPGRPAWGTAPEFATITMGGNDIGILPLILTCIYSIPILGRGCDTVIQRAFDILISQKFKYGAFKVIHFVRNQGKTLYGPNFHIFVTGYAQLFNSDTKQCDGVTFKPDHIRLPAQYLTQSRRRRINELFRTLNDALRTAAGLFPPADVTFVDYDPLFEGHRFCDRFEPNANDDETWFFQYGTTSDPIKQMTVATPSLGVNKTENLIYRDHIRKSLPRVVKRLDAQVTSNASLDSLIDQRADANSGPISTDENVTGVMDAMTSGFFRVCHPKSRGHQAIRSALLQAINRVYESRGIVAAATDVDMS